MAPAAWHMHFFVIMFPAVVFFLFMMHLHYCRGNGFAHSTFNTIMLLIGAMVPVVVWIKSWLF